MSENEYDKAVVAIHEANQRLVDITGRHMIVQFVIQGHNTYTRHYHPKGCPNHRSWVNPGPDAQDTTPTAPRTDLPEWVKGLFS